jgi:hypothetical protein
MFENPLFEDSGGFLFGTAASYGETRLLSSSSESGLQTFLTFYHAGGLNRVTTWITFIINSLEKLVGGCSFNFHVRLLRANENKTQCLATQALH